MSPVGRTHAVICTRLIIRLGNFAARHNLGEIYDSSMGFRLGPQTLLSPDVSFVSYARLPAMMVSPRKFLAGAPDLAVEVISPSDLRSVVSLKLDKYLVRGTRLAWLVDPEKCTVEVRTPDAATLLTRRADVLEGDAVLPGFRCKLGEIFDLAARP